MCGETFTTDPELKKKALPYQAAPLLDRESPPRFLISRHNFLVSRSQPHDMESNSSGIDQQQTAVTSTPRTSSVDRGVQTERNQEKEGTRASPQGAAGEQSGIQAELEDVLRRRYIPTSRKGTPADDQKAAAIRRENWFLVLVLHVHRLALPSVTLYASIHLDPARVSTPADPDSSASSTSSTPAYRGSRSSSSRQQRSFSSRRVYWLLS